MVFSVYIYIWEVYYCWIYCVYISLLWGYHEWRQNYKKYFSIGFGWAIRHLKSYVSKRLPWHNCVIPSFSVSHFLYFLFSLFLMRLAFIICFISFFYFKEMVENLTLGFLCCSICSVFIVYLLSFSVSVFFDGKIGSFLVSSFVFCYNKVNSQQAYRFVINLSISHLMSQ